MSYRTHYSRGQDSRSKSHSVTRQHGPENWPPFTGEKSPQFLNLYEWAPSSFSETVLFVLAQADYNCINQGSPVKQNKIGDR